MKTLLLFLNKDYIGNIYVEDIHGNESFSFSFSQEYLKDNNSIMIDPELFKYSGRQFAHNGTFGFINDMIPDRFGRLLIERDEQRIALENNKPFKKLLTSDYLLKVNDLSRMGGLRIKDRVDGDFLNNDKNSIPPYIYLRDIENASIEIDSNEEVSNEIYSKLLLPGSSLGGARPKANIYFNEDVYIAKFPSKNDKYDVELLEYIVGEIARKIGLDVPLMRLEKYSNYGHTLLIKRFDRDREKRIHYMSAVTALMAKDGESDKYTYLDIVDFIKSNSQNVGDNLKELFKRIVFTYLINNTDNHLRNHAFILKNKEYELSPLFDVNPTLYISNFELNISSEEMSKLSIIQNSKYFGLSENDAIGMYSSIYETVKEELEKSIISYPTIRRETELLLSILSERK